MMRVAALLCSLASLSAPMARAAVFEIANVDGKNQALRQAIADANLTPEPDTILLPTPAEGEGPIRFDFGAAPVTDAVAGNVVLTAITSDITIEGPGAELVILAASGVDAAMLVVRTDPTLPAAGGLELPARLTLKNLTIERGRGQRAGAVVVRAEPPPTGERPRLIAQGVRFVDNQGGAAGAIANFGAPLDVSGCTFTNNGSDDGAGAVTTASGGSIRSSTFADNSGRVGAVEASAATFTNDAGAVVPAVLTLSALTFTDNEGSAAGAVLSLADTSVGGSTFTGNRARGGSARGGAVQGIKLRVVGSTFTGNQCDGDGGAIAFVSNAAGGPGSLQFNDLRNNTAGARGGAVFTEGVALTVTDSTLDRNVAADGGGALFASGAVLTFQRARFTFNRARPTATFAATDTTLDERGADTGLSRIALTGGGGALRFEAGATFSFTDSCVAGNTATAVQVGAGATGDLAGIFWGDAGGPNVGDTTSAGATASSFLSAPPAICTPAPSIGADFFDVPLAQRADSTAQVGGDARAVRPGTTFSLMTTPSATLRVPWLTGVLELGWLGVNDTLTEGAEELIVELPGCTGGLDACPAFVTNGAPSVTFTITDNGNGEEPGEGEGEGECTDALRLSARALTFEDRGDEPSTQTLEVTNDGACELQLIAPLVRKGASFGFSVATVPQRDLVLEPGGSLSVTVTYQRPEDDVVAQDENGQQVTPSGVLVIESRRGARVEVTLELAGGCGCHGARTAPPWLALALLVLSARSLARGRRRGL